MYEWKRVEEFRVTGNLNNSNTKMIMANIKPHIEMKAKVVYSFKSDIHRGGGEIMDYNKTLISPPGMFTSLKEIQTYVEECEQKRSDLDNEETGGIKQTINRLWSTAGLAKKQALHLCCRYL